VTKTVVGYTGGSTEWPTYAAIGDHTEALRITYDPTLTSFEAMLRCFFSEHNPMPMAFTGCQYRSAIYYHTEEQMLIAERLRAEIRPSISKNAAIISAGTFYRAEEYHQSWVAKSTGGF